MALNAAHTNLCAYLVARGLLPPEAFATTPPVVPNDAVAAEQQLAAALVQPVALTGQLWNGVDDAHDWHRNYGLHLLRRDDPAFTDPTYLLASVRSAGLDDPGWRTEGSGPQPPALLQWLEAWRTLAPRAEVMAFTQTGSDAVSLTFDIARRCGRQRLCAGGMARTDAQKTNPGVAFFAGCYGGGRGEAASINTIFTAPSAPDRRAHGLPVPTVIDPLVTLDAVMSARYAKSEAAALTRLEAMVADAAEPIGAIFIEVIQAARGVFFYRREFLAALRALGDAHNIPIIADEIFTVGRTGKFFAWEHHDFVPDFIVFGKGVEVAGVARVDRGGANLPCTAQLPSSLGLVTARYPSSQQLLKSRQILRAIAERDLLTHAAQVGQILIDGLRDIEIALGFKPLTSGKGCLIGTSHLLAACGLEGLVAESLVAHRPRLCPPISLDIDTAQAVVSAVERKIFSGATSVAEQAQGIATVTQRRAQHLDELVTP